MNAVNSLSNEAKSKPYYPVFLEPTTTPNPNLIEMLEKGPMDPSLATEIQNIQSMLTEGYHPVENGYCSMPDGTGYVAVNNVFPGVTVEMVKWWFAWHALEDLRYMLWFPKGHFGISVSEEDRKALLDPLLPIEAKIYGRVHQVVEDTGTGVEDIRIAFMSPEAMGLNLANSPVKFIVGANGLSVSRGTGIKAPAVMFHSVREIEGGVEFRSRFWLGYQFIEGKAVKLLPEGVQIPLPVMRGLAFHNVEEYSHLAAILPSLYQTYGPQIL